MLRVAEVDVVGPVRGQRGGEVGIRVVRVQPRALVLMVVVEGQLLAGGVGQLEHGIQRRVQPAGIDFGDDGVAGAAFETEHVPVARLINAPVDDDRQRDRLGGGDRVVRFLFEAFRQRVHRKGHPVGDSVLLAHGKRIDARLARSSA